MLNIPSLLETRAGLVDEMSGLVAKETAGALGDEERSRFEKLDGDVKSLDAKITRARKVEALERAAPAEAANEFARESRNYSIAKGIREWLDGRLTGREAEVQKELTKEREFRGLAVSVETLLGAAERRSQTVGTASEGGYMVADMLGPVGDRFRPALLVESLGATVLRGLTGNLDLPALASSGSASWGAEDGNATRTTAAFEKVSMTPKTVAAEYRLSRRLMLQNAQSVENILRGDLGFLLAQALDSVAIKGGGTNQPSGILANPTVEKVTTETAFSDTCANLIGALELDDVTGSGAFLTSPKVAKATRKIKDGQSHVIPTAELFHGKPVSFTNQVPDNIGTGGTKSALIYGAWAHLVVGYWSAVDLLANPYHADVASNGGVLLHAFLDADVAVRHPTAFAYAEI